MAGHSMKAASLQASIRQKQSGRIHVYLTNSASLL